MTYLRRLSGFLLAANFLFLLTASSVSLAQSSILEELYQQSEALALHENPTWLGLIHVQTPEDSINDSDIISTDFYLSTSDTSSLGLSQPELRATLKLFVSEWEEGLTPSGICKYPARYFWLSQNLNFPFQEDFSSCESLSEWIDFNKLDSISILQVGSYLSNPASTFGHVLIRLNSTPTIEEQGLFDPAINFGARVPENENSVFYIAKGLTGGYNAGFTTQEYYLEDLVYSGSEQRDIWDNRLNLTTEQEILVAAHLWELKEAQFKYYFLNQNCGYRVAEVLETVTGVQILPQRQKWFPPVNLFIALENSTNPHTGLPLIENTSFIASPQRKLYENFEKFSPSQQDILNEYIKNGSSAFDETVFNSDFYKDQEKVLLLNFLIDYNNYQFIGADKSVQQSLNDEKERLIRMRFGLPAEDFNYSTGNIIASPSQGSSPARFSLAYRLNNSDADSYDLSFSPFYYDSLGRHSDLGSELIFLNTTIESSEDNGTINLSKLELFRVQKLKIHTPQIAGESRLSWRVSAEIENETECRGCLNGNITGGLGFGAALTNTLSVFAFTDIAYSGLYSGFGVSPSINLNYNGEKHGFSLKVEKPFFDNQSDLPTELMAEYRYRFSRNIEIQAQIEDSSNTQFILGASYFF